MLRGDGVLPTTGEEERNNRGAVSRVCGVPRPQGPGITGFIGSGPGNGATTPGAWWWCRRAARAACCVESTPAVGPSQRLPGGGRGRGGDLGDHLRLGLPEFHHQPLEMRIQSSLEPLEEAFEFVPVEPGQGVF